MPTPPPAFDAWHDAKGTPIRLRSRVEQITVDEEQGALPSRLHQRGQVIGWGNRLLFVISEHDNQAITLRPHHVRVLTNSDRSGCPAPENRPVTTNERCRMTNLPMTRWNGECHRVIHATCVAHRGPMSFITLVMSTHGGVITLDPYASGTRKITIDRHGARVLSDALIERLG
ncbi:MAG: hypothetical protein ACRDRW_15965 [Pseudonocardiaceae bacterium]